MRADLNKKGSILMIGLWILAILAIFALGLARRSAINLKLAKYQRDNLILDYMAKAGINRAIAELLSDSNNYDAPTETWADKEDVFKKIFFAENDAYATVSYLTSDTAVPVKKFGCQDEDGKLNINACPENVLALLFEERKVERSAELAAAIKEWTNPASTVDTAKKAPFSAIEELIPALENFYAKDYPDDFRQKAQTAFNAVKYLITVYTPVTNFAQVNINTAPAEVLRILARSKGADKTKADNVAEELAKLRDEKLKNNQPFINGPDINETKINQSDPDCVNIFNALKNDFIFKSDNFRISSRAYLGKMSKNITAVYNRQKNEFAYWHQ